MEVGSDEGIMGNGGTNKSNIEIYKTLLLYFYKENDFVF